MASPPPHMLQAYTPPLSLWGLVEQQVPQFEQDEVKSMLGSHIVDQSLELHSEIEMLLEIWRDMRDEQKEGGISAKLPEPPNQRERLIQEINFFVENVKEKANQKGINPDHILKHHSQDVIEYVSDVSRPGSSAGRSSRLSDGRETPMMVTSPDRILKSYEVIDEVEAVNDKLNVNEFDKICAHLRESLEKEVEQLVSDLEFLQTCLDDEADVRDSITTPRTSREPSLKELREERASLEKELLLSDNLTSLPHVQNRAFAASTKVSLPSTPSTAAVQPSPPRSRPPPIKASHNLHGKKISPQGASNPGESHTTVQSRKDIPLKASHDIFTKRSHLDNDTSQFQSETVSNTEKHSVEPNPPKGLRGDRSINEHVLPSPPQASSANSPKSASNDTSPRDRILKPNINRRLKTPSPSRIRVVNLNSIVDIHTEKREHSSGDGENQFEFASPDQSKIAVRPSSADRFRKMVMGYRDGE